ncbi:hypothetical protein EVAR_54894_1 [Eumeta japonica]|uniref:DUF5641 domain-containing protein n=1 Tax=Eumeta variegata TaxID=151549 RepID=A0A4C2A1L8_EUMVA|nr:hypothetical protein EVAR_54894_1 [Eumeta japonica]
MGGSWERLVRSIKVALSATLHTRAPKDEVLHTAARGRICCEPRPLHTHIGPPEDPTALTPIISCWGQPPADGSRDILDTSEECSRKQWRASQCARRDVLAEMAARIPPRCRDVRGTEGRPPIKVGDAVVITDPAHHVTRPRARRTGLPRDRRARARVVDIRSPWTAETTNCAPGGPAYRSGVVARSDRGGLLTAELRPPARLSLRPPIS